MSSFFIMKPLQRLISRIANLQAAVSSQQSAVSSQQSAVSSQHSILFDIGSCLRYRARKFEPGQGQRVMGTVERTHCALECCSWHGSHVHRAEQVPPGDAEITLACEIGAHRTRVVASDIGTETARNSDWHSRRTASGQRTVQGGAITLGPVKLANVGVTGLASEPAVLLQWFTQE